MAKALVMCIIGANTSAGGGLDLTFDICYAGPDVPTGAQTDRLTANVLYNDTLAQMAGKIVTEAVNIGSSRWNLTVARTDVLLPSFAWGS